MNFRVEVKNKELSAVAGCIVCGNSDYSITFAFDNEWAELPVKTARFVYVLNDEVKHKDVVFEGVTVEVPELRNITEVYVGVFAGDLHTTTPLRIACKKSILCGDESVQEEPPADVYAQIIELVNNKIIGERELPAVSATDKGKALTVDENGQWQAGEIERVKEAGHATSADSAVYATEAGRATNADSADKLKGVDASSVRVKKLIWSGSAISIKQELEAGEYEFEVFSTDGIKLRIRGLVALDTDYEIKRIYCEPVTVGNTIDHLIKVYHLTPEYAGSQLIFGGFIEQIEIDNLDTGEAYHQMTAVDFACEAIYKINNVTNEAQLVELALDGQSEGGTTGGTTVLVGGQAVSTFNADSKQNVTDINLKTTSKTIVGAINELLEKNVETGGNSECTNRFFYYSTLPTIKEGFKSGDICLIESGELYQYYGNGENGGWGFIYNLKGADGKTPVKGEDYWTEADKTEIVNSVIAEFTNANGEAF